MNSRERIRAAMNFEATDRLPKDLGGMRSTSVSAFVYPKLVETLGLAPRKPLVYDVHQMLALPETDVLDALGCDVVALEIECDGQCLTNAFHSPDYWTPFDFNGRLDALVPRHLNDYGVDPDGTIIQRTYQLSMPTTSYVFNEQHEGQPFKLDEEPQLLDLGEYRRDLEQWALLTDDAIERIVDHTRRTRQETDRAILVAGGAMQTHLGIAAHGGMAVFPVICLLHPDYVH